MPYSKEDFDRDVRDQHIVYDYDARDVEGNPERWRYETWFFSETRVVYEIHGGPMAGRKNYQEAQYQCIRPGELWQCNWLEETGTVVSMVWDIPNKKLTTLIGFSKGHWENAKDALGDKRNKEDLERFRGLAKIGHQAERKLLSEQGNIVEQFTGAGNLQPIEQSWPVL